MIIEYYATDAEDEMLERVLKHYTIKEWFNPEEDYYVLETDDPKVVTVMSLVGIELYISGEKIVGGSAHL